MDIYEKIKLQDCPYCGGAGLLEEEGGWSWSVLCMDCGAQTAPFEFRNNAEREQAAEKAALTWNLGKVIRANPCE